MKSSKFESEFRLIGEEFLSIKYFNHCQHMFDNEKRQTALTRCVLQIELLIYLVVIFSELTQIVTDVISDPTLPRTADHPCKSSDKMIRQSQFVF